ncbi:MAG: methylated-DNA--[protein]-cysteine S-methyltransferase [Breznakiellaceae bacterium]
MKNYRDTPFLLKGTSVFLEFTGGAISFSYTLMSDTPLGTLGIVAVAEKEKEALWSIAFLSEQDLEQKNIPYERIFNVPLGSSLYNEKTLLLSMATQQIEEYFKGLRRVFSLPLAVFSSDLRRGTPFQQKVWQTLLQIPYGSTCSYGDLAERLGLSRGYARAVGNACGSNPLPLVIPCHRVIGTEGALGGYSGGIEKKRWLLTLEGTGKAGF